MKRVLIVFPTAWDRRQLESCRPAWGEHYEIVWSEPADEECPASLDVLGFIDDMIRSHGGRIDGVLSSSDYPGAAVAATIAERLGLPGPGSEKVLRCSHKYYSRIAQCAAVPEATPDFELLPFPATGRIPLRLGFPCFVKPVKGSFSMFARRIDAQGELDLFFQRPAVAEYFQEYLKIFNALVRELTPFEHDGGYFLAEELLDGSLVTVEGYAQGGHIVVLGIVDSVLFPGRRSFQRFDYPSRLPQSVLQRLGSVAEVAMGGLGWRNAMFNLELVYDRHRDKIGIVEINPRLCGQFADLYQKVTGVNSYEIALALAVGAEPPTPRRVGGFSVAASVPLRVFSPVRVVQIPGPSEIALVAQRFPQTLVWVECRPGQILADFERGEDGESARYGIVNAGAASPAELELRVADITEQLGFVLALEHGNPAESPMMGSLPS